MQYFFGENDYFLLFWWQNSIILYNFMKHFWKIKRKLLLNEQTCLGLLRGTFYLHWQYWLKTQILDFNMGISYEICVKYWSTNNDKNYSLFKCEFIPWQQNVLLTEISKENVCLFSDIKLCCLNAKPGEPKAWRIPFKF